ALRLEPDAMAEVLSLLADALASDERRRARDRLRKARGRAQVCDQARGMSADIPAENPRTQQRRPARAAAPGAPPGGEQPGKPSHSAARVPNAGRSASMDRPRNVRGHSHGQSAVTNRDS